MHQTPTMEREDRSERIMANIIVYEITPVAGQWSITRNGEPGASYATAEAAFEVAVAQASIDMRSDNEIGIHVRRAAK